MVVESVAGRGVACNVHQLIGIIWFEFFSVYQSMLLKRYLGDHYTYQLCWDT